MNHKLQVLESMMRYHLENKTGQDKLTTMLSQADLKAMGLQEFQGRFTHTVNFGGRSHTFEVLPR